MADNLIDLAILVLVIDKHVANVKRMLARAHAFYPEFPILVLDNTSDQSLELPKYCIVYKNNSENKTTAYSRKLLVSHCDNEYVWFLDADDDVLRTDKMWHFDNKYPIYRFSYLHVNAEHPNGEVACSDIPLWCHFIKADLLREAQQYITEDDYLIYSEDLLLTKYAVAVTNNNVCERRDLVLYKTNASDSHSMADSYTGNNAQKLEHCLTGRMTYLDIVTNRIKHVNVNGDNPGYFIFIMMKTEGITNKMPLIEMLLDAGITEKQMYVDAYNMYQGQLTDYARNESMFTINSMFEDALPMSIGKKWCREEHIEIDEFGKEVTIMTDDWLEDIPYEYKELRLC